MKELYGHQIIANDFLALQNVFALHKATKIMVVSNTTYEKTYLKEWFSKMPFSFVSFSQIRSNPKYEDICDGTKLFLKEKCDFILSIGGGSAIDTAKAIKMFAVLEQDRDYLEQERIDSPIPFLCVPTTAGSGSEGNGNAVFYVDEKKYSYYHETCIPDYIYFEPRFLKTMPEYTKRSSLADAIAQCIESIWAKNSNEESLLYAVEGLKLLLDHAMEYLRGEEEAYEKIQLGAFLAGKAIGISKTTAAHALSYSLAKTCNIAHGHAVFLLLPAIYEMTAKHAQETDSILQSRLELLRTLLYKGSQDQECVANQIAFISRILDLQVPPFVGEEQVEQLVEGINIERLSNHPILLNSQEIYDIYIKAFRVIRDEDGKWKLTEEYQVEQERSVFVKGLQEYTLETLLLTQRFLNEHKLTFFLGEGTLLGAVRHHGFIPWDDDVDILMPREDYDKLVELAKQGMIPDELNFDALETNDKHWVLGAKMQLVRETPYIQEKVIPLSKCHGPYVDIFPIDYWPKAFGIRQRISDLYVKVCRRMLFMKTGYSKGTNKKLFRIILRGLCLVVSNRWIEHLAIKNMKKFYYKDHKYAVNLCSYYPYYKQVVPSGCYKEAVMIPFEGHDMPIPKEYDYILKTIYGVKYDSIPPYTVVDMRKHAFKRVDD